MDKHLHIVSFDIPYPADYGGVIDVFYKIVWLHKQGVKIHLHCFTKGRQPQPELDNYCESINYYPRKTGLTGFSFTLPYIVNSRKSDELLVNLEKDDHPILFEGVHTTYWLYEGKFTGRQVFIRLHNVEYKYYRSLANNEDNFWKRCYFLWETYRLKKYEKIISHKASLLALNKDDANKYLWEFQAHDIEMIPAFSEWNEIKSLEGSGKYCLYHGNLSINENIRSAEFVIDTIAEMIDSPVIIAGKNPPARLIKRADKRPNVSIIANPSDEALFDLIQNAHINILFSFNVTGIKLKLLNALYNGRFCLTNTAGAEGSGVEELCEIYFDEQGIYATDLQDLIRSIMQQTFDSKDIEQKKAVLYEKYSNEKNSKKLMLMLR